MPFLPCTGQLGLFFRRPEDVSEQSSFISVEDWIALSPMPGEFENGLPARHRGTHRCGCRGCIPNCETLRCPHVVSLRLYPGRCSWWPRLSPPNSVAYLDQRAKTVLVFDAGDEPRTFATYLSKCPRHWDSPLNRQQPADHAPRFPMARMLRVVHVPFPRPDIYQADAPWHRETGRVVAVSITSATETTASRPRTSRSIR